MVSFSCEVCNDTIVKKKLDQHTQRCRGAYFTCIDCNKTFDGTDYRNHTSCISEDEKYQKALYKGKKKNGNNNNNNNNKNYNDKNGSIEKEKKTPAESADNVKVSSKKEKRQGVNDSASKIAKLIKKDGMSLYKLLKKLDKDQKNDFLKQISVNRDDNGQIQITKYL